MAPHVPARVLIVRLGALGDVTQALACAGALRRARPDLFLGWAVHELAEPLVSGHPWVDRVHRWPRGSGLAGLRRIARELRRERYDLVLDLQRLLKSALLSRLAGAGATLGYDRRRSKEGSWLLHRRRLPAGDPRAPMVLQALEFAAALGCSDLRPLRLLPVEPAAEAWAEARCAEFGAPPIVLNLGASKPPNRWLPERFAIAARELARRTGAPVVLSGGPVDRELFAAALAAADGRTVHDLVGRTTIPQLISLLRRSALYVGCDTGPMHLAAALGRPCVALFGPADPRRTGPFGEGHIVVQAPERHGRRAMSDLGVEVVLEAVQRLL
jgi:heptosyltransferase-1